MQDKVVDTIIHNFIHIRKISGATPGAALNVTNRLFQLRDKLKPEVNDDYTLTYSSGWVLIIGEDSYRISNF